MIIYINIGVATLKFHVASEHAQLVVIMYAMFVCV